MVDLLWLGFLAGLIVAVSPCVLPVLPIVLAGSASGGRRRPFAIVGGLVVTFSLVTLFGTWVLQQLGLPGDLLRDIGIGMLFLVAATLLVPRLGQLIEAPLARLVRHPTGDLGGGFALGAGLGLVFVPCAGPVLGAVIVQTASDKFGWWTIATTALYAVGLTLPLAAIAVAGQRGIEQAARVKRRLARIRPALGLLTAAVAVLIAVGLDVRLARFVPNYVQSLQNWVEGSSAARGALARLDGVRTDSKAPSHAALGPPLADYGPAPDFQGISHWLNTPGGRPLDLAQLRGKVVLVDFWTYSCVNCLRTLPYLETWYRTYAKDGFVIVGVHTPEFAFEHVLSNVRAATHDLGVRYPVALDNGYSTWNAYVNQYWPAEYLIDRDGHIRHARFGEGDYSQTEDLIRRLLAERHSLPPAVHMADRTPTGRISPETYLGYERGRYAAGSYRAGVSSHYRLPVHFAQNEVGLGGTWRIEEQRAVAGAGAELAYRFVAQRVHLVLGGHGTVRVLVDGRPERTVRVTEDRLYTLVELPRIEDRLLELRFSPGVEAYAFTFG